MTFRHRQAGVVGGRRVGTDVQRGFARSRIDRIDVETGALVLGREGLGQAIQSLLGDRVSIPVSAEFGIGHVQL